MNAHELAEEKRATNSAVALTQIWCINDGSAFRRYTSWPDRLSGSMAACMHSARPTVYSLVRSAEWFLKTCGRRDPIDDLLTDAAVTSGILHRRTELHGNVGRTRDRRRMYATLDEPSNGVTITGKQEYTEMVRVYINRRVVAANQKSGERSPPITILRGKGRRTYALGVELIGTACVIYAPDMPLSCGARVWIECDDARPLAPSHLSGTDQPVPAAPETW